MWNTVGGGIFFSGRGIVRTGINKDQGEGDQQVFHPIKVAIEAEYLISQRNSSFIIQHSSFSKW
jgi:hypothetical protein